MPPSSRARPTSGSRLTTSSRPVRSAVRTKTTIDDLADEVANKLTIQEPRALKGKAKVAVTNEERKATAMRTVNTVSKTLSELVSRNPSRRSQKIQEDTINSAIYALQSLRELNPGDVDTERAASSMVGKLVFLEMVRTSFALL